MNNETLPDYKANALITGATEALERKNLLFGVRCIRLLDEAAARQKKQISRSKTKM